LPGLSWHFWFLSTWWSQPPMQISDCLSSTQQQPTVPAIRQRPECRKQNVSLLLTRQLVLVARSFMAFLVFEYVMLVSLGAWLCGCPGAGFSFWSVVLRFPLHPMLDSKLCYQGYLYTKHATSETNQWWKCAKRSSIGCRGNLSTTLQNENPVPGQPPI
jgi:hypothetical protein